MSQTVRIGVVAPASRIDPGLASRLAALAAGAYGSRAEIVVDPQCFLSAGHFAGDDAARAEAFVRIANDPAFDALWAARGGYGSARLIEAVLPRLTSEARAKVYLGYSDAGALLGALDRAGFPHVVHGPMPADLLREGGERAVGRALAWLVDRDAGALEPSIGARPCVAFNLTIFASLVGTSWQPDVAGRLLLLEEVSEHMYRIDRTFGHITANPEVRKAAGILLGRCSLIPPNEPDFGQTEDEVARFWCARSGIPFLGRADIGHDVENKVTPFRRAT